MMDEQVDTVELQDEPIYQTKDGQTVTKSQLTASGYDDDRVNKGLQNGILKQVGDTKNPDQVFKTKDGQQVTTKDLLASGYSQERIDKGIHNGILSPHFEGAPVEKKNPSENVSKEPSVGGLVVDGTTPKTRAGSIDFEASSLEAGNDLSKSNVEAGKEIPPAKNSLELVGEINDLSKVGTVHVSGGTGGAAAGFSQSPDAYKKSQENYIELKGSGLKDKDIAEIKNDLSDLSPEVQGLSVTDKDGKVSYPYSLKSLGELRDVDPIAYKTKLNAVKTYDVIRRTAGTEKANEFSRLQNQNQAQLNQYTDIEDFNRKKEKQKEIIRQTLKGDDRDIAMQRVDENSAIILNDAIPDSKSAEDYLNNRLYQSKGTLSKNLTLHNALTDNQDVEFTGNVNDFKLESIQSKLDPNNPADQIAFAKYKRGVNLNNALSHSGNLDEAALNFASSEDDHLAATIKTLNAGGQELPNSYKGEIVANFLNDPEIIAKAQDDPEFAKEYIKTAQNLYFNYPDYAKKEIGNIISQAREDEGYNNWFANVPTKGGTDKLVDKLVADGKMTELQKNIYLRDIAPELGVGKSILRGTGHILAPAFTDNSPIATPDLLTHAGEGWDNTMGGLYKSLKMATRIPTPTNLMPTTQSNGEVAMDLLDALKNEKENTVIQPKGLLHKASAASGDFIPLVVSMAVGGGMLKGAGKAGEAINMALQFAGNNAEKALVAFPDSPLKQKMYTGAATSIDMFLGRLLPHNKALSQEVSNSIRKDITGVISDFASEKITADAAKKTILNRIEDLVTKKAPEILKANTETGAIMAAFSAGHNGLDIAFGAKPPQSVEDFAKETAQAFETGFLGNTLVAAAMAGKNTATVKDNLLKASANPEHYIEQIKIAAAKNPEIAKQQEELINNVNVAVEARKVADAKGMNEKQAEDFILLHVAQGVQENTAKNATVDLVKEEATKQAKDLKARKEKVYGGEVDTKLSVPIEGLNEQGIPIGDNVPPPVDLSKVADQIKEPAYVEVFKSGDKEMIDEALKEVSDQWHDKVSREHTESKFPKEIIDAAKEKYPQESNEGLADKLPTVPAPPTEQQSGKDGKVAPDAELGIQQGYAKKAMTDFINSPDMGYSIHEEGGKTALGLSEAQVRSANGLKGGDRMQSHEHTNIELTKDEKKQLNKIESDKELGDIDGLEYAKQKRALAKKIFERASNELQQKANEQSGKDVVVDEGVVGDKKFVTHNKEVVTGKKLTDAVNKVADDMVESAKKKREEYYASHVTEKQKDDILKKDIEYANEVRDGKHLDNLTIAQRINYELTGETVPLLPKENATKPEIKNEEAKATKVPDKETGTSVNNEPPDKTGNTAAEGTEGEGDWTHINKKDITDAEDLASKHPFGESETWKNSVKKGLEKLAKVAKKGESLYDAAKNKVNEWAAKVKQEILDDGKSTFNPSDEEIAQMAYHRTMTNKRIAELEPDLTSPIQAVRDAAEIVLSDLEAQKEIVDYVLHNTATTAGRAFNIRQMVSKIDSENGLQVKRMDIIRKQKGQPLSEKQEQEIRDIHDEEVKNQKAKDEYAQKKAQQDFEEAVKLEVDRRMKAKKDKAASDKTNKPPTEKRAKIADKLNEWADKFEKFGRADLPDGTVKNSLGPDVQKMVSNAMRFVAEGVRDGKNIPEILKDAVKKFGESVLDHIKGGLRDIGITDREIEGDRQYALNEIKKLAEKEKSDMLTKSAVGKGLVRELVNSHIDNGLTGKDVFTELNKDLKEIFPEITEQQVRDAYLKEGEFTLDKKENINKAKVDAKNELRSIAKNETDIADLKAERDLRKREREERQKTNYENQLIAEKKGLTDKKALTEKQEKRLVELNKELDRIKQRKEKDAKVSNPKDLNRSDKEKAVLDEIKKEKEQWAKEKQAQRDLEVAAKKAQTAAKNEADRLKALTEKRDRLQKGQRDAPSTSTPKVESPAIEQVKAEIKEADKKLREAESEANRINKEMQAKKDKLAEHEANIKRAENGLESIKTNRKKSDRQIDTDIADAETRLKKELNKQGLKLEKGSKAEKEQKQKVADKHNERVDKVIEGIDKKLEDATLTANEKAALENAKKILEKSKVNPDSALDVFDAVDKAEKNTELARAELANSDKLADVKREIANSQIQMGRDKLQTEQDILLQRHKDSLQKKIDENERKIEAGEFVEKEPARLKTSDAESVRLEIKDRETKNKFNALGKKAQREAMTKREKVIDTLQSLYVIGLVGRLSTLAKVGVSAITKQPLNTITSQTFGRLGGVLFPKIENALRGEGNEGWRKEKNRYMAHYGALGKEGMAKLISKGKENAQKADEAYINAKGKLEDIANQHGKDSKQYKDFEKGEFKKAEDKQKQALLDNVTNSLYEWIGGNSWADAAEVFLHSSAKLEQLLGKGEREMWSDKTRKEKIMFVLSTSAATHGVLKNFSARAEFAASFVARLENKMKQGIDISKADEILKTVNESYIAFQRGKYQEDNAITGGFKAGLDGLRIWAEKHPDYKYAADIMAGALKFKNPIVRTPLNIAREAIVEYTIGVPLAIAKYRNSLKDAKVDAKSFDLAGQEMKDHMKNFMDNIPADKADFIYRAFRKGGFGLGVMAITAMGGINFGGFFNRDEKRRKKGDELGINEVEIGGKKLSHLQAKIFEHTSAFFPALLWSNYDRVRDENLKAGHGEIGANLDAVMKDFQGMMDQIPIGNEVQNPLSGIQVPLIGPFLTEYAEASDVDANGEQIKRTPKGNPLEKIWQNIEMKIPGLRQNVPIRGGGSGWGEQDLKNPSLKALSDAGATKPDYTPDKIATKYINGKPTEKLSDKPKKVQDDYITKHTENYKLEADKLVNGVYKVYKNKDGGVHIKGKNTNEKGTTYTPFKDLTADQKKYLEGQITRKATVKTKKALKFELDKTEKTDDQ